MVIEGKSRGSVSVSNGGLNRFFAPVQVGWSFSAGFAVMNAVKVQCRLLLFGMLLIPLLTAQGADRQTVFDEGRLQVDLPDGWKDSEQNQGNSDSVGGWESSDRKTSLYVLKLRLMNQGDDMRAALDRTIENFDRDENWLVQKIGTFRQITVNDMPASYVSVELELRSGSRKVPFVFHFAMVGAGKSFFLLQGSTMKPVWKTREDELIRMIKSFRVLKEE